uniref:Uncharacterized protein n=1 Tax=Panagrolaimus davidi TaxID=227884 RepID=A0A914PK14_9BILA
MALKLMAVCKFFQHKNGFPYFVVKNVESCGNIWIFITLDGKRIACEKIEDISRKLWITGKVDLVINQNVATTMLHKTVVCNIQILQLDNQRITLDEFKQLTDGGKVEMCDIMQTIITNENGKIVSLEDICECIPNVKKLVM